jgi:hypothetical protein
MKWSSLVNPWGLFSVNELEVSLSLILHNGRVEVIINHHLKHFVNQFRQQLNHVFVRGSQVRISINFDQPASEILIN